MTPMSKKAWAKSIAMILFGSMMFGFSYSVFMVPNRLTGGGISGVAAILYFVTGFPPGVATFILNIPLFILAFRDVGKRFFILSVIGMTSYTIFIEIIMLFQQDMMAFLFAGGQSETMLAVFFAGIFGGLGTGLVIRAGGSTGGSDLLGGLINRKRPNISVGQVMMIFDIIVVFFNAIFWKDITLAMYSIISIVIVTLVLDFFVDGFKECRAYYVISTKNEEISKEVLLKLDRGATSISARGMYTQKEKNILLVLIKKRQQAELRNIIKRVDPAAFIFSVSAKEVLGEGFNPLDPKEKSEPKTRGGAENDIDTGNNKGGV